MHILHVVGARPNFMKATPVCRALAANGQFQQTLVHTGQHFDPAMSDVFFQQLGMPAPDVNLDVGSATHARQTADIMIRFEPVLCERRPDLVLVYGDVNSTVATALVCSKLGVSVGHVEAGLRSRDRSMPEEINRLVTDQLSDLLFTPSADGDDNLRAEGIPSEKIHCIGNVMIDTLVRLLPQARPPRDLQVRSPYILVTLHRPANVDELPWLEETLRVLAERAKEVPVVFPVHPRTQQRVRELPSFQPSKGLLLLDPLPYLEFLALQQHAAIVVTDSGGIQEETSFLGVPCLTVRENTERPITLTHGTNTLVGRDPERLASAIRSALAAPHRVASAIPLWDGHAADRLVAFILRNDSGLSPQSPH
jgi:UDP-N-acetylglucosamine 2-epimerase (non-hydrolysing)